MITEERVPIVRKNGITIYGIVGIKNRLSPFIVETDYSSHIHSTFDSAEKSMNKMIGVKSVTIHNNDKIFVG